MLEKVTRMIKSVIFTALVFAIHVEVFKDDDVSMQSDICYVNGKMENGTEKAEEIHHTKRGTKSRENRYELTEPIEQMTMENITTHGQCLKEEAAHVTFGMKTIIGLDEKEIRKQNQNDLKRLKELFTNEMKDVKKAMINLQKLIKYGYSCNIQQLKSFIRNTVENVQHLLSFEMKQARNKLTSFMNDSKIELNEILIETKTDIREDVEKIKECIDRLGDSGDQYRNETYGLIRELKRELQENVTTIQKYIANEIRNSRSIISYEIRNNISGYGNVICSVCAVYVMVFLFCCRKRKPASQQRILQTESPQLNIENSVAVVSFTEENKDLHLSIARSVSSAFRIHPIYMGGINNVSNIELTSKVCLVFVDKNERNIILETDVDISKTRSNFVESQVKKGSTHVIVIYCQHEGSRDLSTLYNRNLGNIKQQATLRELQRQNRVLSIDKQFSPYQSDYLRMFLNETLME